jgi:hypothetical protein
MTIITFCSLLKMRFVLRRISLIRFSEALDFELFVLLVVLAPLFEIPAFVEEERDPMKNPAFLKTKELVDLSCEEELAILIDDLGLEMVGCKRI